MLQNASECFKMLQNAAKCFNIPDKSCVINDMKLIFSWDRGTQTEPRRSVRVRVDDPRYAQLSIQILRDTCPPGTPREASDAGRGKPPPVAPRPPRPPKARIRQRQQRRRPVSSVDQSAVRSLAMKRSEASTCDMPYCPRATRQKKDMSKCFKLLQTIPRGGSQQQSASARDAAQARPVDSTASARMCNSGAHFRVPICRFGDSSHSFGTSSCNSASVEQTSLRDQPSAPAPNAVCKIPSIVMQACGPTKRRGDFPFAPSWAPRGRRPWAGRDATDAHGYNAYNARERCDFRVWPGEASKRSQNKF